jgi:hypothetical protein
MPVPSHESERSYTMQKKKKCMLFFYSMYFQGDAEHMVVTTYTDFNITDNWANLSYVTVYVALSCWTTSLCRSIAYVAAIVVSKTLSR